MFFIKIFIIYSFDKSEFLSYLKLVQTLKIIAIIPLYNIYKNS